MSYSTNEENLNELGFCEIITEDDPDGSDRGGFHQIEHEVMIDGEELIYEITLSDFYAERMGFDEDEDDEMRLKLCVADDKESVLSYLKGIRTAHVRAIEDLDALIAAAEKTTTFRVDGPRG